MAKTRTLTLLLLLLLTACAVPASATQTLSTCPAVVAHRGTPAAPENTLPGIADAAALGADMVELDVRWSSSSFPVLMHDSTADRTTNGTGLVASLGLGYLTSLWAADYLPWSTNPAFANTRVPYGWEFMNAAATADVDLLLDLQVTPTQLMADKLAHYISLFGWESRTVLQGSVATVTAMRGWYPNLRYALIEYNPHTSGITTQIRTGEHLQALGVEAYVVPARDITPDAVAYWHSYGLDVWTWVTDNGWPDNSAEWDRVTTANVDAIITNNPAGLLAHC